MPSRVGQLTTNQARSTELSLHLAARVWPRGYPSALWPECRAHLSLRDGKKYQTGYYLNEFVVPYRKLVEAGYEPVIANPNGDQPAMDANSNNAIFLATTPRGQRR